MPASFKAKLCILQANSLNHGINSSPFNSSLEKDLPNNPSNIRRPLLSIGNNDKCNQAIFYIYLG